MAGEDGKIGAGRVFIGSWSSSSLSLFSFVPLARRSRADRSLFLPPTQLVSPPEPPKPSWSSVPWRSSRSVFKLNSTPSPIPSRSQSTETQPTPPTESSRRKESKPSTEGLHSLLSGRLPTRSVQISSPVSSFPRIPDRRVVKEGSSSKLTLVSASSVSLFAVRLYRESTSPPTRSSRRPL